MSNTRGDWLKKQGLTNSSAEDFSELSDTHTSIESPRDVTFCSSDTCMKTPAVKGSPVFVGEKFLDTCPQCGGKDFIYHERVSEAQAKNLEKVISMRGGQ